MIHHRPPAVDLLFVIDNSSDMGEPQQNLAHNIHKLIEALRGPALAGQLPDLHIGVVSTDLGAGDYGLPTCEQVGGDGGKLLVQPWLNCPIPTGPYIEAHDGKTNVQGATGDAAQQVAQGIECIAELGGGGCGFEHPLEAARRALDPTLAVNPGFVRRDALLVLLLLTDEDDCSARRPELFDPAQVDTLGQLASFRCFQFGIRCDINDPTVLGPREGCHPAHDWLVPIEDYVAFFNGLKGPDNVLLAAIAGPASPVAVGLDGLQTVLRPSCQESMGKANPAIRIKHLLDAFGDRGLFNRGIDGPFGQPTAVDVCDDDFSPALRLLGQRMVDLLQTSCIGRPLVTAGGALVCRAGDTVGSLEGRAVTCSESCLEQAQCVVQDWLDADTPEEQGVNVVRCEPAKFRDATDRDCGTRCPCWRIVADPVRCNPTLRGSSHALEVLRAQPAPQSLVTRARCSVSTGDWGSAALAALPQCR